VWAGFTAAHNRGDMYRALLEGVALEQALVTTMIEERAGLSVREFITIGGGAASGLWRRIMADVTGKTVRRSQTVEASSLGVGNCAAVAAGWFAGMSEASEAMSGAIVSEIEPDLGRAARYGELLAIYRELYPRTRGICQRLSRFAEIC